MHEPIVLQDNFLDGTSSTYLEELEERYLSDPSSVDKTWASFFHNLGASRCFAVAAETAAVCHCTAHRAHHAHVMTRGTAKAALLCCICKMHPHYLSGLARIAQRSCARA